MVKLSIKTIEKKINELNKTLNNFIYNLNESEETKLKTLRKKIDLFKREVQKTKGFGFYTKIKILETLEEILGEDN